MSVSCSHLSTCSQAKCERRVLSISLFNDLLNRSVLSLKRNRHSDKTKCKTLSLGLASAAQMTCSVPASLIGPDVNQRACEASAAGRNNRIIQKPKNWIHKISETDAWSCCPSKRKISASFANWILGGTWWSKDNCHVRFMATVRTKTKQGLLCYIFFFRITKNTKQDV